jgi:hypothetical protein
MTYTTGQLIQATDYNGFVSTNSGANINATWNSTYGQTSLATVAAQSTVTATQWASLNNTLTTIGTHQGTTLTSRTSPVAGNTISVLSNLSTDLGSVYTNRFNAASSGTQVVNWTGTASQTTQMGNRNSSWTITFTDTVTFANATAATNFFGAGGIFKIQFSKSSTGTSADTSWNNFATNVCGVVYFSSDATSKTIGSLTSFQGTKVVGGSGTPTVGTATGYNQLTGTPVTIYQQNDTTYNYTGDYIQVQASKSGATMTLTTYWFSAARSTSAPNRNISGGTATTPGNTTGGTAPTTIVSYLPPGTTTGFDTSVWGTPTVASTVSGTAYV